MLEKNTVNFLNKIYIFKIFTMNFKRRKRHSNAYSSGAGAQPCPDALPNTASYENPKSSFPLPFRFCFETGLSCVCQADLGLTQSFLLSPRAGSQTHTHPEKASTGDTRCLSSEGRIGKVSNFS